MLITEQQIQKIMNLRATVFEHNGVVSHMIVDSDERSAFCDKVCGKIDNVKSGGSAVPAITFTENYFMSRPRQAYIPLSECVSIIERPDRITVVVQKGNYSVHGM